MSTPISKLLVAALSMSTLAACDGGSRSSHATEQEREEQVSNDGKVECALGGSERFERTCSTEQINADGAKLLVIHHPDGGFRRFDILTDGRGLAPADGFDETRIAVREGGMIEVSSGDDVYRLPAQIKNSASADAS